MTKNITKMTSDAEAERFRANDLSNLDLTQFKPAQFEFEAKNERVNMRLPRALLTAIKDGASHEGIPYQRFIRQLLERAITTGKKAPHPP